MLVKKTTCPKCRKPNALTASILDRIHNKTESRSEYNSTHARTWRASGKVRESCKYCDYTKVFWVDKENHYVVEPSERLISGIDGYPTDKDIIDEWMYDK